ncbi:uncharacterized protein [Chelonus insularis]|uniref:uncharacterized protein n=1 Tax=Chelonus insularis TaxID=460826 RepID=UPI00158E910B|nr:uncharacterized protein LOC118064533 [Chelonus insularis]XP_034935103.1 uncharacterized protein LOC118064533 [Chelonus insularis]
MWISLNKLTLCIFVYVLCATNLVQTEERSLSRRKRYVVFPEGSSFSIALCMTVHTLTPDNIFTEGVNWGISYDLPNESKPALEPLLQLRKDHITSKKDWYNKKNTGQWAKNENSFKYWNKKGYYNTLDNRKKYYYRKSDLDYFKRRHRRELYNKLEVIMNAMGFDGRSCILRALCEASQRLMPKGNTLVEEMMRIAFSLPLKRILLPHEPEEHEIYTNAHRAGYDSVRCDAMFSGCSFSLIDMALGKYNMKSGRDEDQSSNPDDLNNSADMSIMHFNMK